MAKTKEKEIVSSVYGPYSQRLAWQFVNLKTNQPFDTPNVMPWGINKSKNVLIEAIQLTGRWPNFKHFSFPKTGTIKLTEKLGITYIAISYESEWFTSCIVDRNLETLLNDAPSFK